MPQKSYQTLDYALAESGVVFVSIDVNDRPVNVLTPALQRELGEVAAQLKADENAIGAVIHSGKSSFMAGGDLKRIVQYYDMDRTAEEAYQQSRIYSESLRQLETCGKPVAVAINGNALGGGLELALACHHRVAVDDPDVLIGLPEVTLGLLPGGGGTQRLPRLIGLEKAISMILSGKSVNPAEALKRGIIDQLAPADELLAVAEKWLLADGNAEQPWDRRGYRIPGGSGLSDMTIGRLFQTSTARISARYRHNYPAPIAALRCLFNGSTVKSMDAALKIESREFSALTRNPVARNIIRTLFINKRQHKFRAQDSNERLVRDCRQAYMDEGSRMLSEGSSSAFVENAGLAAGMRDGPLSMAAKAQQRGKGNTAISMDAAKQRLLCIQSLAAAELWETSGIDPVEADLASILGWGFPSYTGGVMSYVDTMGLRDFIGICDGLVKTSGEHFRPTAWLREKAQQGNRIYPVEG